MKVFLNWVVFICITSFGHLFAHEEHENQSYQFIGYHLLGSYVDCDVEKLSDVEGLRDAMRRGVEASGATLLDCVDYVFPPNGFTMIMLLSESHASIHTYPEHGSCFFDFFTCGINCSSEKFDQVLREYLQPKQANTKLMYRDEAVVINES